MHTLVRILVHGWPLCVREASAKNFVATRGFSLRKKCFR